MQILQEQYIYPCRHPSGEDEQAGLFMERLYILRTAMVLRISIGLFCADSCVSEPNTEPSMRLFQRLAIDKINSL